MVTNGFIQLNFSVVLPNGLIANLSGPYEDKRHDSTMLNKSGLLPTLRCVAFYDNKPLCIYANPAYPLGVHLQGLFKHAQLTPQMRDFNKGMSEVRIAVEWMFGNITKFFSFVDFKRQTKLNLSTVGKMSYICNLLENARTCLYGNIVHPFLNFYHLH